MLKRYLAGEVDSEENALGRDGMAASRPPSNHTLDVRTHYRPPHATMADDRVSPGFG